MGASGWWRNKHEWEGGTNLSSKSDLLKKVIFSRVILRSVTVIKISLVPVLCPGNERQTEGAGERPNVIDIQWKQCVREPKPCYRGVHNKTLGNYSNRTCMTRRQTAMSKAAFTTDVWPLTCWKQQTVYQTFALAVTLSFFIVFFHNALSLVR